MDVEDQWNECVCYACWVFVAHTTNKTGFFSDFPPQSARWNREKSVVRYVSGWSALGSFSCPFFSNPVCPCANLFDIFLTPVVCRATKGALFSLARQLKEFNKILTG